MSRRRRAGLVSLLVAPVLAGLTFIGAVFATGKLVPAVVAGVLVGAIVSLAGSRGAGYAEGEKVAGWTIGGVLLSLVAMAAAFFIGLLILLATCDECLT